MKDAKYFRYLETTKKTIPVRPGRNVELIQVAAIGLPIRYHGNYTCRVK